jgi:hypothetical protein
MTHRNTLFFTIRTQQIEEEYKDDFISKLVINLNKKLAKMKHGKSYLEKYATSVKYEPYTEDGDYVKVISKMEKVGEDGSPSYTFAGNINHTFIFDEIGDQDTNLAIFYTRKPNGEKQLEAIFTYDVGYLEPRKQSKPFVYVHSFTINNDIPLDERSLSGANLFKWFYETVKKTGFYCVKISALGSAMPFWRKVKFIYVKDNLSDKMKTLIGELEDQLSHDKKPHTPRRTRRIRKKIKWLDVEIREAIMRRIRSTDTLSPTSTESSIKATSLTPSGEVLFMPTNEISNIFDIKAASASASASSLGKKVRVPVKGTRKTRKAPIISQVRRARSE